MDMRFNLDQLFEEQPSKEETSITQENIQVKEEEQPHSAHKEAINENEINLDLKEEESKSVELSIVSQAHSYALDCPNLELR